MKKCAAPYRAGTPYPRAIAVAAKTMRTTSNAWTKLIRAKPLAARGVGHASAGHRHAPPNQGNHRAHLENQNRREQAHLGQK